MKKILMLGTGGTIACVPSADGLVPELDGAAMVQMVPELAGLCAIDYQQVLNLDSSNIAPQHWQIIARAIAENYQQYDGFVITHGTDTMAYSAAALSLMVENCNKPVVFTGAQLPVGAPGTDARDNIYHAFLTAVSNVKGVVLTFGNAVIHGRCAKKLCSENFNGFGSINRKPLATIENHRLQWEAEEPQGAGAGNGAFAVHPELEEKVAVVKITPGLPADILNYFLEQGYRGIVLEGFGAGGVPNGENNWLPVVEKLLRHGMRVVCTTQCVYDGVDLTKYPMGVLAERLGAESAGQATVEAALTRLMWELAHE